MSGLLYPVGNFHAQGTEAHGKGVSEEQSTFGKVVTVNSLSLTLTELVTAVANKRTHGKA